MAKPRKDQEMEETRRIMERLVNTPHKPHEKSKASAREPVSPKKTAPPERGRS